MRIVVDSIDTESGIAIIEFGEKHIEIAACHLPSNTKEGDILRLVRDEHKTNELKASLKERLAKLTH